MNAGNSRMRRLKALTADKLKSQEKVGGQGGSLARQRNEQIFK